MSGLSNRRRTGRDARAALVQIISSATHGEFSPDKIIRELAGKGYAIVNVREPTARRGNAKPPIYTGPEFIGQSHSARLAGQ